MTVTDDPRRGLACDEIRPGYEKFFLGSPVLFFKASTTRVVIVRILHRRMVSRGMSADALVLVRLHSLDGAGAPAPTGCAWAMALATVAIVGMPPSCIDSTAVEGTMTIVALLRFSPS